MGHHRRLPAVRFMFATAWAPTGRKTGARRLVYAKSAKLPLFAARLCPAQHSYGPISLPVTLHGLHHRQGLPDKALAILPNMHSAASSVSLGCVKS
jgi:hypothetical protein